MWYTKFIVVALICIASSFQCNKYGETKYRLTIQNNSSYLVSFYVAALGIEKMYPDTALETNKPAMPAILPGKSAPWDISLNWENFFHQLPADTLSIYLFNTDTLTVYDWSQIRSQYKILRRYDLSLQDLKNSNFILTYP